MVLQQLFVYVVLQQLFTLSSLHQCLQRAVKNEQKQHSISSRFDACLECQVTVVSKLNRQYAYFFIRTKNDQSDVIWRCSQWVTCYRYSHIKVWEVNAAQTKTCHLSFDPIYFFARTKKQLIAMDELLLSNLLCSK